MPTAALCTCRTEPNASPSVAPSIGTLIAASIAVAAGDMAMLQLMMWLSHRGRRDGCEATSTGFRCALEPRHPHTHLALLAMAELPSPAASKLSCAVVCARRTRSRDEFGIPSPSRCKEPTKAHGGQRTSAQGGILGPPRVACTLPVRVWGWGRRGGQWSDAHRWSTRECYACGNVAVLRCLGHRSCVADCHVKKMFRTC